MSGGLMLRLIILVSTLAFASTLAAAPVRLQQMHWLEVEHIGQVADCRLVGWNIRIVRPRGRVG